MNLSRGNNTSLATNYERSSSQVPIYLDEAKRSIDHATIFDLLRKRQEYLVSSNVVQLEKVVSH